jgi:hypothetical protein
MVRWKSTEVSEEHFLVFSRSKNNPSKKQLEAYYLLHAGFSLDLFFGPEDAGNVFLRNVG